MENKFKILVGIRHIRSGQMVALSKRGRLKPISRSDADKPIGFAGADLKRGSEVELINGAWHPTQAPAEVDPDLIKVGSKYFPNEFVSEKILPKVGWMKDPIFSGTGHPSPRSTEIRRFQSRTENLKAAKKVTASVKVMRSYDYCHFEVSLGTTEEINLVDVNKLRIEAAKLADHAVEQYKNKKAAESKVSSMAWEREDLRQKVKVIKENFPQSEWTPEQKAVVKKLDDLNFAAQFEYDEDYDD